VDSRLRTLERHGDARIYAHNLARATGSRKLSSNDRWLLHSLGWEPLAGPCPYISDNEWWIYHIPAKGWFPYSYRNVNYIHARFMKKRKLAHLLVPPFDGEHRILRGMKVHQELIRILDEKDWQPFRRVIETLSAGLSVP